MSGYFDPAFFDPAFFDTGEAALTTRTIRKRNTAYTDWRRVKSAKRGR